MVDVPESTPRPLVIYVDDEKPNRVVFEANLKDEFNVLTLPGAASALKRLAQGNVAVLVTDIRMPEMDGLELLRLVKDRYPQVVRMVITAYSDVDPILRAINEGLVARYIVKPWVHHEVAEVLRWACAVWNMGKDRAELQSRLLETERLASLGGVAATSIHDLQIPLMMVMTTLDELREAIPALHDAIDRTELEPHVKQGLLAPVDVAPELITDAKRASEDLEGVIALLGKLIKPGGERGAPPVIDPLPIVRHVVVMHQRIAADEVRIGYQGPPELPHIRMSPVELTQVLLNLVGNATQAVQARGEPNRSVAVDARRKGEMLELEIRDEGIGMTPEVLERVGTPWFTTRAEGTGLGLANCQRLIGCAGGRLRIESEPGVGTTVTVLLPTAA